jgi:hypothetical protein
LVALRNSMADVAGLDTLSEMVDVSFIERAIKLLSRMIFWQPS